MIICFDIITSEKFLGIYLDHDLAHIIEYRNGKTIYETLSSGYHDVTRRDAIRKDEASEINESKRKLQQLLKYYKALLHHMQNYTRIVLFGEGEAKNELYKLALSMPELRKADICVSKKTIVSDQQADVFVREYFDEYPVHLTY